MRSVLRNGSDWAGGRAIFGGAEELAVGVAQTGHGAAAADAIHIAGGVVAAGHGAIAALTGGGAVGLVVALPIAKTGVARPGAGLIIFTDIVLKFDAASGEDEDGDQYEGSEEFGHG